MYRQVNIFEFIEKPTESKQKSPLTQFEQLFEKVNRPVILCANCLCQYCTNNVEEVWGKVKPEEMQEPCFNCDECRIFSGDCQFRNQQQEECGNFVMSDHGASRNRKKIKLIKK